MQAVFSWCFFFLLLWRCDPTRVMASSFLRFPDHTQQRTTVGTIPLNEWSARRRDLYLTTQNTHNRQTSMPPVRFEPTISVGKRPQTYALDRAATGTVHLLGIYQKNPFTSTEKTLTFFRLKRTRNLDNCNDCLRLDTKKTSSRSFYLRCKKEYFKIGTRHSVWK